MTPKQRRDLQDRFLDLCLASSQTLDELLQDMDLPPQTLAGWLTEVPFRKRLHRLTRQLRRARELQVQLGAARAAAMLTRMVDDTAAEPKAVTRAACVDMIRLARDSQARRAAANPSADEMTKYRALHHPAVPAGEADELMRQLSREDDATAP